MRAALADDNTLNRLPAAGAGQAGSSENAQLGAVVSPAACYREKIGFTGTQGCTEVAQTAFEHSRDSGKKFFAFNV